jgi:hypothetical protein
MEKVTDPALLEKLNAAASAAPKPVTDPVLLQRLNAVANAGPQGPAFAGPGVSGSDTDMMNWSGVADKPTMGQRVGRNLMIGSQGAARGALDAVMLPDTLMRTALNLPLAAADAVGDWTGIGRVPFRFEPLSDKIADTAYDVADAAGVPVVNTDNLEFRDKLGYNASRFGTESVVGGQLLFNTAKRFPGLANPPGVLGPTPKGQTVMPKPLDPLVQPYSQSAGRTMVGDATAGVGAGAGLTVSQEYMPQEVRNAGGGIVGVLGDFLAMLGGGVGGATTAQVAGNTVPTVQRKLTENFPEKNIPVDPKTGRPYTRKEADIAAQFIQDKIISDSPANIAQNIQQSAEGFRQSDLPVPSVGLISGDTGLETYERGARAKNPATFIEQDKQIRDKAVERVGSIVNQEADPRAFPLEAERIANERIAAAQQEADRVAQLRQEAEAARVSEAAPIATMRDSSVRDTASRVLDKTIVDNTLIPMAERQRQLYAAIDPEGQVKRPVDALATVANQIEAEAAGLPPELRQRVIPQGLIDDIKGLEAKPTVQETVSPVLGPDGQPVRTETEVNTGGPGEIQFKGLNQWRPIISEMENEARRAGRFGLADNLRSLKGVIDLEAERLAAEGGEAGQRAMQALNFSKNEMLPTWKPGPGDAAAEFRADFNADPKGRTFTPPSQTAGRFLQAEQPERAQALFRILEKSQDAATGQKAARDYLIADMAKSGISTKTDSGLEVLNPATLRSWRNRWGSVLESTPALAGVRDEVDGLIAKAQKGERLSGDLTAQVNDAARRLKLTEMDINQGALGLAIGRDPQKAVASIFNSKDPQMSLRALVKELSGNDKAAAGLKRAVIDHVRSKVMDVANPGVTDGTDAVNFGKMAREFKKNEQVYAEVFSPKEMNALRQSHQLLEPFVKRGGQATVGSPTAENNANMWRTLEAGFKLRYGMLKGGGILRSLKLAVSTIGDDSIPNASRLIEQMWHDPELAAHLLTRPVQEIGTPAYNDKLQKLIRYGEAGRSMYSDQDEEAPPNGPMEITVTPKKN